MPGVWSRFISWLFDKFDVVVVYLDDIGIFSKTNEEHKHSCARCSHVFAQEKLYFFARKSYMHIKTNASSKKKVSSF